MVTCAQSQTLRSSGIHAGRGARQIARVARVGGTLKGVVLTGGPCTANGRSKPPAPWEQVAMRPRRESLVNPNRHAHFVLVRLPWPVSGLRPTRVGRCGHNRTEPFARGGNNALLGGGEMTVLPE